MYSALTLAIGLLFVGFILLSFSTPDLPPDQKPARSKDTVYTFQSNILPLLQSNCNPCHFPRGKVYAKLPFDDYKTVVSLGKKLNTRFKQKKQHAIIDRWIESGAKEN